jgi:hypothetical protein
MASMNPTLGRDKRNSPRFPVQAHIRFRLLKSPTGEPPEAELHNGNNLMSNISRTGCLLSTKNFLEPKAVIEVEFPLEKVKEVLKAEAEVVRANNYNFPTHGRYEYGLRFTTMHPHFRETLDRFFELLQP